MGRVGDVVIPPSDQRPSVRSQALAQGSGRLVGTAAQAIAFALFARLVAPVTFGEVAVINGSTTFVSVLLDFGLPSYIAKRRALAQHDRVMTAVRLNAISTIGLGFITCIAVQVLWPNGLPGITPILIALANTIDKNVDTLLVIPIADGATRYSAASFLIRRLSWLLLFIGLHSTGVGPTQAFCVSWFASEMFGQAHARAITRRMLVRPEHPAPWRRVFRETIPFYITAASSQIRLLDSTAVSAVAGATEAGLYSAAAKLVAPFLLIPGTLASLVIPNALRWTDDGRVRFARVILVSACVLSALALAAYPVESWVLRTILGNAYSAAAPAFCFSLAGAPFVASAVPLGALLAAAHRERVMAALGAGGGILAIALLISGAAIGNAAGAAIGLGGAALIQSAASVGFLERRPQ